MNNMSLKPILLCVFIFYFQNVFAAENLKSVFVKHIMECSRDHPVTAEELNLLRNHKFTDSKNVKCLQACVLKKAKWMNSQGMFDDEVAFKTSQEYVTDTEKHDNLKKMFNECKKVNDVSYEGAEGECERAFVLAKCLAEDSAKATGTDKDMQVMFLKHAMECSNEFPVTAEEFEQLKKHKIPDTKNAKCLMACVFRKLKWMDDEGMFNDEVAYSHSLKIYSDPAKLESAKKLYELCKKVNEEKFDDGAAGCERAKALAKCFIQNSAKMGFANPE